MKKLFFPLISILVLSACSTPMGAVENLNDSYLMHVECVADEGTRAEVLLLLRRGHAKDVRFETIGAGMTIEAAYYKADNDIGLVQGIADDLRLLGKVMEVEVRDNPRMVRQNR